MRRRRGEAGPQVQVHSGGDYDFAVQVVVHLEAGESICAARDPAWVIGQLGCAVAAGGSRWEGPGGGTLSFGTGRGASISELDTGKSPYVVAVDLVLLWTSGVRFDALAWPATPAFAVASGEGRVWLLAPGYRIYPGYSLHGQYQSSRPTSPVVVDPAQLAFVRGDAGALTPAPGPRGGLQWVQLAPETEALLHSWDRPAVSRQGDPAVRGART
jgi:hypothetical protein